MCVWGGSAALVALAGFFGYRAYKARRALNEQKAAGADAPAEAKDEAPVE